MIDPRALKRIHDEILAGLPNEKPSLDEARENQAFFDLDGERYIPMREAESTFDYERREKRMSGFLRECIEVLTDDLYSPGPSRSFDDAAGQEFLERVWQDNLVDALMQRADELAHLNRVAAIQVDAGAGDFANRPVTLRLWGRDEFVVWTDPCDCNEVVALCTIDRFDLQTRYRLWTDTEVSTFVTLKAEGTAGGTAPRFAGTEPHDYGCVPFGFFWYELPVRGFFPSAPGTFLRKAEVRIDDRLSRLDESIHKHLNPIPIAENVPDGWCPVLEPQRFIVLRNRGPVMGDAGYQPGPDARLSYLQSKIDVAGAWLDLTNYANQALEAAHVPLSAVRMKQSATASGVAIMAEQEPLRKRAKRRRAPATYSECYTAAVILRAAGNHYGRAALAAAAANGRLNVGWSEPSIPIPGPDRDNVNKAAVELGTKSRTMIIMETYSCDRPTAHEILRQIAEDRKFEEAVLPAQVVGSGGTSAGEGEGKGASGAGEPEPELTHPGDDETHEETENS